MRALVSTPVVAAILALTACRTAPAPRHMATAAAAEAGALAQIYYWKAKPGKFEEYSRYVREVAEPIDREAQRRGAFVSVTTYIVRDTLNPWTHMRVFILRDSVQLRRLSVELDSAGIRLEPDSARRRARGEYSATLRDRVGAATGALLR